MLSTASGARPLLPADVASSMAILADRFGSMAEAEGFASGGTWPSGLDAVTLSAIGHVAAAAPSPRVGAGPAISPGRVAAVGAALREGPLSGSNLIAAANAVMQAFQGWAEQRALDDAFAKLHLDRHYARQVMAAYAYVWAHNFGPWMLKGLPAEGDARGLNERFARALSRYELDHPGTVYLATRGHVPSMSALQVVWDATRGGFAIANPPITIVERTSKVDRALSANSTVARAKLGIQGNGHWQAHHVLPFAVIAALPVPVQQAIARSGWMMNSADNLIALPADQPTYYGPPHATVLPWHNTNHPTYSAHVAAALAPIAASATTAAPGTLLRELQDLDLRFKTLLVRNRRDYHPRLR